MPQDNNHYWEIGLGLTVSGATAELALSRSNYEFYLNALKNDKYVFFYKGQIRAYKNSFVSGSKWVSADELTQARSSSKTKLKIMKMGKAFGTAVSVAGGVVTAYEYGDKNFNGVATAEDHVMFPFDMGMTGLSFVPGPGWVLSGFYFGARATIPLGFEVPSPSPTYRRFGEF